MKKVRVEQMPESVDEVSSCKSLVWNRVCQTTVWWNRSPAQRTCSIDLIPRWLPIASTCQIMGRMLLQVGICMTDTYRPDVVSKEMTYLAVDRMKVARAKRSLMDDLRKEATRVEGGLQCVLFDNRVDNTKTLDYD